MTMVETQQTQQSSAVRKFTADEVWKMVEIGLLGEDEPYELLDGELLYVSPQGESHAKAITRLNMFFAAQYGPSGHMVRVQMPVGGIVDSIPEPDLLVVTADVAEQERRPEPQQAVLLVEAAVTSQPRDRRKGQIYAGVGAAEYWIVDIPRDRVIVHTGAKPDGSWTSVREVGIDGSIGLPGADVEIAVAAILRPARPASG
jgi:Uma2 family endonuclease